MNKLPLDSKFIAAQYELKMYRTALLLGVLIYAPIGWLYSDVMFQFKYDGFLERLPIAALCALGLIISYSFKKFNKYIRLYIFISSICVTAHFMSMVEPNGNHWLFITGAVQIPLILATIYYHKVDAILYFMCCVVLGEIFLKNTPFYLTSYTSFFYPALIGTYFLIYYFFLSFRKQMIEKLESKNIELDIKNNKIEVLSNFATQAAHDIRSPIMALKIVSDKLSNKNEDQSIMLESINRIQHIAEDLVSRYRQETTKSISTTAVELDALIYSLVSEKQLQYTQVQVIFNKKGESFKLNHNIALEILRILSNLIQNSVEAIDGSGKIDINLTQEAPCYIISIMDNGCGIPPEYQNKIFERGLSLNKKQGTGLGLAHAKEYIESIGSTIELTSKVGKGTLVTLRVPVVL